MGKTGTGTKLTFDSQYQQDLPPEINQTRILGEKKFTKITLVNSS